MNLTAISAQNLTARITNNLTAVLARIKDNKTEVVWNWCQSGTDEFEVDHNGILINPNFLFCLVPAVLIILLLTIITRRSNVKGNKCIGKRLGILPPVDFLRLERNRFSYSLAYACIVVSVTNMLLDKLEGRPGREMIDIKGNEWLTAVGEIVTVLLLTIMYLPFFLCLSTSARLLGAILGILYAALRSYLMLHDAILCPRDPESILPYWPALIDFPPVAIHIFLVIRYFIVIFEEARRRFCRKTCSDKKVTSKVFACKENLQHVRNSFKGEDEEEQPKSKLKRFFKKAVHLIYPRNPEFKFSVAVLSTVVVSSLMIYQLLVMIIGLGTQNFVDLKNTVIGHKELFVIYSGDDGLFNGIVTALDVSIGITIGSSAISALITYFQMYRMLVGHRNHVIQLIKSKKRFLPEALPVPSRLVGRSLEFCGFQIAYFLWSFVVSAAFLTTFTLLVASASLILPEILPESYLKWIKDNVLMKVGRVAVMFILAWIVQRILALVVFKDRSIDSKVVNVDNRRMFLLVSFFFLFFNIVVGIMSCSLRIIKSMVLGLVFLPRIDRPYLMQGFTSLDKAYLAYIGFLHLQVAHKHPVVLVFCQLLWDEHYGSNSRENSYELRRTARVSRVALNRWHVAVILIRNPSLKPYRKSALDKVPDTAVSNDDREDEAEETSNEDTQRLCDTSRHETVV